MAIADPNLFDKGDRKVILTPATGEYRLVEPGFVHWPDAVVVVATDETMTKADAAEYGIAVDGDKDGTVFDGTAQEAPVKKAPARRSSRAKKGPVEDRAQPAREVGGE